jgi:hypothetical protein
MEDTVEISDNDLKQWTRCHSQANMTLTFADESMNRLENIQKYGMI